MSPFTLATGPADSSLTMHADVFLTGGTGYMGQRLIPTLMARGHRVRALVRPGSERKLPDGATPIAYLWARTVRCESPRCGAEIPIYKISLALKEGSDNGSVLS